MIFQCFLHKNVDIGHNDYYNENRGIIIHQNRNMVSDFFTLYRWWNGCFLFLIAVYFSPEHENVFAVPDLAAPDTLSNTTIGKNTS